MQTYTLKVVGIVKETEETSTICFKQPALKKIKYIPGQYLTVIVNINNRKYKRPYSLSSTPGIDNTLNITIKRLLHGVVSNHLIDMVKEGDLLEVMEPMGDFVYDADINKSKDILLWGAGSGITPLISILKAALSAGIQRTNLHYCSKSLKQTIFYDQLLDIKAQYINTFSLNLFCTEEKNEAAKYGRIDAKSVIEALNDIDITNSIHYICGPIGLKNTVKTVLAQKGISNYQVFSEDFEHIINENELSDINTQIVEIVQGEKSTGFEVIRGKSILEATLDSNIDLPYSCQTGSCTLCKATLLTGYVKKISDVKSDHELNENERLLCCSYPLTNNVKFRID